MQETKHHRKGATITKRTAPNIAAIVPVDCPWSASTPLLIASFMSVGVSFPDGLADDADIAVKLCDIR